MSSSLWVIIPAAGLGRRMTGTTPKQYLPLAGRTVIEWAMTPFLQRKDVIAIVISHAPGDSRAQSVASANDPRVKFVAGGAERADTVWCALESLQANEQATEQDWVLVHDAARPCLHADDLTRLIAELSHDSVGGLLATPVSDTLKLSDVDGSVASTVSRDNLWRALTPQMFRFGVLQRALRAAKECGMTVTDESSAVEALGLKPKLVSGRNDNIKITQPEDLAYAEYVLRARTIQ
jgi:2-C-methyl-D-erythritol 4-phosphate cytidylyltransferase